MYKTHTLRSNCCFIKCNWCCFFNL